jgi:hypothetical protein
MLPILRSELARLTSSGMVQPISIPQEIPAPLRPALRALLAAGAGLGAVILVGAVVLWLRYGTAVFFETIASGLSACF